MTRSRSKSSPLPPQPPLMSEKEFLKRLNRDEAATIKLAEGINALIAQTDLSLLSSPPSSHPTNQVARKSNYYSQARTRHSAFLTTMFASKLPRLIVRSEQLWARGVCVCGAPPIARSAQILPQILSNPSASRFTPHDPPKLPSPSPRLPCAHRVVASPPCPP